MYVSTILITAKQTDQILHSVLCRCTNENVQLQDLMKQKLVRTYIFSARAKNRRKMCEKQAIRFDSI